MLGAVLAFASAAFFGLNNATVRRGVLKSTVLQAMAITVPLGVPIFVLFALAMGGFPALAEWDLPAWGWMTLAGVVHFVFGRYGNYKATQDLGSTLSAPVQQLSILVALVLGFAFLGERVNTLNLIGILLVIFGPVVMVRRRKVTSKKGAEKGFQPKYLSGSLWGGVAALGYGSSPLFVALGLRGHATMADSVAGVLVSYIAASVVVILWVLATGGPALVTSIDRSSRRWFLLSTLFVALSQLFRYMALAVAPISVVTPIQRLSVVFRLLFNAAINREHEVLDTGVILAILVSVLGAVALAADTSMLLSWVGIADSATHWLAVPIF